MREPFAITSTQTARSIAIRYTPPASTVSVASPAYAPSFGDFLPGGAGKTTVDCPCNCNWYSRSAASVGEPAVVCPATRSRASWANSVRSCATSQRNAAQGSSARAQGAARTAEKPNTMKTLGNLSDPIDENSTAARLVSGDAAAGTASVPAACTVLRLAVVSVAVSAEAP